MKFLADEDFPKPLIIKIRNFGFSIKTIQQKDLQGSSDERVASIALKEKRILLTFDKDFLKNQSKKLQAVIFSFPKTPTAEILSLIEMFLRNLPEELLKRKIIGNVERDKKTVGTLVSSGWRVLILWECSFKGKTRLPADEVIDECAS